MTAQEASSRREADDMWASVGVSVGAGALALVVGATGVPVASGASLAGGPGGAGSGGHTAYQMTLTCDDIGEVRADLGPGGTAVAVGDRVVALHGRAGFVGRTAAGRAVTVAPSEPGVRCLSAPLSSERLGALAPGLTPSAVVSGRLVWSASLDTSSLLAAADARASAAPRSDGALTSFPYAAQLASYLASRPGSVQVAVRRSATDDVFTYTKGASHNVTASIVKASVMAAVMRRAQLQGRALTSWEKSQLVPMIRNSDNDATTRLWSSVGGAPTLARLWERMGLTSTWPDPGGRWGLTMTTAADQTRVMDHFGYRNAVLSETNRLYGLALLRTVTSSQRWGVSAGVPSGQIALKNGWLPRTDGWHVNSIGFASAYPAGPYTIAVLTQSPSASMSSLVSTIEGASRIVVAREKRGVRGDVTSDGIPDLHAVDSQGRLLFYRGKGRGAVAPGVVVGTSWGSMVDLMNVGDLTGDGVSDIVGRSSGGLLRFYVGSATGGVRSGRTLSTTFGTLVSVTFAGDLDGDGVADLVGRTRAGELYRYAVSQTSVAGRGRIGVGYLPYRAVFGATDLDGDRRGEVVGVRTDGSVYRWRLVGGVLGDGLRVRTGLGSLVGYAAPVDLSTDRRDDVVVRGATAWSWYPSLGGGLDPAVGISTSRGALGIPLSARLVF